jgi:pseudouridine-5'-phosphate glycosidase
MSDYRSTDRDTVVVKRRSGGTIIAVIVVAALVIVGLLFATGFWSANVKEGALPEVSVKGGELPNVDVDSKEVVVGTSKAKVEVPKVETETKTIDVPVVGVKDDNK